MVNITSSPEFDPEDLKRVTITMPTSMFEDLRLRSTIFVGGSIPEYLRFVAAFHKLHFPLRTDADFVSTSQAEELRQMVEDVPEIPVLRDKIYVTGRLDLLRKPEWYLGYLVVSAEQQISTLDS